MAFKTYKNAYVSVYSNSILNLNPLQVVDAVKLDFSASLIVFAVAKLNLRWLKRRKLIQGNCDLNLNELLIHEYNCFVYLYLA